MNGLQKTAPVILSLTCLMLPAAVMAQALTVMGGNDMARECFSNASQAASLPSVSSSMLAPCNYALDHVQLSQRDRAATYVNRGILLLARENTEAALADYETAVAITPEDGDTLTNRGNAWFMMANYEKALNDYARALSLGITQTHRLYFNIGLTHEKLQNTADAEAAYRKALELNPDWPLANKRLARLNMEAPES